MVVIVVAVATDGVVQSDNIMAGGGGGMGGRVEVSVVDRTSRGKGGQGKQNY